MSLKVEEMMEFIAEKLGIPQRLLTTKVERMMMQQQAMQMAQQAAAENPEAAGQAVGEMAQQQG
jgi:dihydropteroate synthase